MITRTIANKLMGLARKIGRSEGDTELAVYLDDHSIHVRMESVDKDGLAWDPNLYRYGNVFLKGYANPIKPTVTHNSELEEPDTVDLDGDPTDDADHEQTVISSNRYISFMKQELAESLLNPRQQWRLIAYAIIGLAVLMLINVVVSLSAAGAF